MKITKVYITFGQEHVHSINGKTLDKDCIGAIECTDYSHGRALAFEYFNGKFHNCYSEAEFTGRQDSILEYYPRGVIGVN